MLRIRSSDIKDFNEVIDKYMYNLEYLGYVHYDRALVNDYLNRFNSKVSTLARLTSQSLSERTGNRLYGCDKNFVIEYYKNYKEVPSAFLKAKSVKNGFTSYSDSFSAEVVERLKDKGYLDEVGEFFSYYVSAVHKRGSINTLLKSLYFEEEEHNDGGFVYRCNHSYSLSDTLRTYTNGYNHQAVPKDLHAIRAPKGYVIVSGDFEQSDLKIAYNMLLRDRSNIDYFYKIADSYEAMARFCEGYDFDLETFRETRDLYKQNTLSPIYGGESATNESAKDIIDRVTSVLSELPVYNEYVDRIKKKIDSGLPVTLVSYFGNMATKYNGPEVNHKTLQDQSLNWPVQTGTSEVVMLCCNHVMDEFAKLGITPENGGIYSYLNRHDEPIFLMKKEHLDKANVFFSSETILIDDWMPLKIKFNFQDIYGEPNEELQSIAESYRQEEPEMNVEELIYEAKRNPNFFIPCKNTLNVAFATVQVGSSTVLASKDETMDEPAIHKVDSIDVGEVRDYLANVYNLKTLELHNKGYNAIHFRSSEVTTGFTLSGNLTMVFSNKLGESENTAIRECALVAAKYLRDKEIEERGAVE